MSSEIEDLQYLVRQLRTECNALKEQLQSIRHIIRRCRVNRVRPRRASISTYDYNPYYSSAAGDIIPRRNYMDEPDVIISRIRDILR